ncbi:MAG TPA: hypothetical protein VMS04_12660 [Vicinamibacterales bacterium]|jgi:hypothetical protein|nr:hypothetical protein [Vicinamibacterales bacterium]
MPAGRPSVGFDHIDRLHGSFEAKARLKAIVETVASRQSVVEACEQLHLSSSRFHVIRCGALQAAVDWLEPRPAGRPSASDPETAGDVRQLEQHIASLESELRRQKTRADVAFVVASRTGDRGRGSQSRSG